MNKNIKQIIPTIAMRGITVFPHMLLHFDADSQPSVMAMNQAMQNDQMVFLVTQKTSHGGNLSVDDLNPVGTISRIKQILKTQGDGVRVLVEGVCRAKVVSLLQSAPFVICEVLNKQPKQLNNEQHFMLEALRRRVVELFEDYYIASGKAAPDMLMSIVGIQDASELSDVVATNILVKQQDKQSILEAFDIVDRLEKLITILGNEISVLEAQKDISQKVKTQLDKNQKEYFLREQLKVIQNELGDGTAQEVEEYRNKLALTENLPQEVVDKINKEIDRLGKMPPSSHEGAVVRTYLDCIFEMPWGKMSTEKIDIEGARKILEKDHYGLEKIKERILEYLAIRKLSGAIKSQILCFVGPPGVGKTSIAQSIARAINREYVRMSLGGVRDEADIRGHRRTYIGAMPGRVVTAIQQARSMNPLILLDEIDKMGNDFRGDPASAMLEVLDPEQNKAFRDHFLEVSLDLSNVLFVTTANDMSKIPRPLLDRMEIISIGGYTEQEKLNIAKKYITPKQINAHGLSKKQFKIKDDAILAVINHYTREAGVRSMEREIAKLCRKAAKQIVCGEKENLNVTGNNIEEFLGAKRFLFDNVRKFAEVGVATGLAWTAVGGDTLSIEVNTMPGTGKVELTGQLGSVMKESASAAISFIRSRAELYGIDADFYKKTDIHVHIPEGATPKDGPSAGITMATAIISALSGIAVKNDVAMTGEVTLRGRVLPIGGLKEKALAAHRAGIFKILIPTENVRDIDEIQKNIREIIEFIPVSSMDDVLAAALVSIPKPKCKFEQANFDTAEYMSICEAALPHVNEREI